MIAAALGRDIRKTVVLTGAMVPCAFGSSDGLFNLQRVVIRSNLARGRVLRDERPILPMGLRSQEPADRSIRIHGD